MTQVDDGNDIALFQPCERQIGEIPVVAALAEEGLVQRRAIPQEADVQVAEELEVPLPLIVVTALLHLVPADTAVLDRGVAVLDAGREQEEGDPGWLAVRAHVGRISHNAPRRFLHRSNSGL
jgi:hypothetical protein